MNVHIRLTEEEWDSLCDRTRKDEESELPRCCGNISTLRDCIIAIRENGGVMTDELETKLREVFAWCADSHDWHWFPYAVFRKFIAQAGLPWPAPLEE